MYLDRLYNDWGGESRENEKKMLAVSVSDEDLTVAEIRNKIFGCLEGYELVTPSNEYILRHQGFLPGCNNIEHFLNYLNKISGLNPLYLQAVSAIVEHNSSKKSISPKKQGMSGVSLPAKQNSFVLGDEKFSSYDKYIQACSSVLYDKYHFRYSIVGEFDGLYRREWHKVKTPYGTFTRGNRNKEVAPSGSKFGDIFVEDEGYMIGERMLNLHKGNAECVVIDGGHQHGSKGKGTAKIIVMYDDGTNELVVPRALQKLNNKFNGLQGADLDKVISLN